MNNAAIKNFDSINSYDDAAVKAFTLKMQRGLADWSEFLPLDNSTGSECILVKMKHMNDAEEVSFNLPNSMLYTLKNEVNQNFSFGFAITDLFTTILAVKHSKNWWTKETPFEVAAEHDPLSPKVVEFTYQNDDEKAHIIEVLTKISDFFNKTSVAVQRWNDSQKDKNAQIVMQRFGFYLSAMLTDPKNLVTMNNPVYAPAQTYLHWFSYLPRCRTWGELKCALSAYNLDFESFLTGFEHFLFTFERAGTVGKRTNERKKNIARVVCID